MDYEKAVLDEISKRDHAEETIEKLLELIGVEYEWSSSFGFDEATDAAGATLLRIETKIRDMEAKLAALREENARLREALEKISELSNIDGDNGEHRDIASTALASARPAPAKEQGEALRDEIARLTAERDRAIECWTGATETHIQVREMYERLNAEYQRLVAGLLPPECQPDGFAGRLCRMSMEDREYILSLGTLAHEALLARKPDHSSDAGEMAEERGSEVGE